MNPAELPPEVSPAASEVTRLLQLGAADRTGRASEELLDLVYEELRSLAHRAMAREPSGHTLQPTALVHEAWLRLVGGAQTSWEGRAHFFRTAARAMRRILVDRARRVDQPKHGGNHARVSLAEVAPGAGQEATAELELEAGDLSDALDGLEAVDARLAEIVTLRFFAGLSVEETGQALGVSSRTVKREWSVAKAWLYQRLGAR